MNRNLILQLLVVSAFAGTQINASSPGLLEVANTSRNNLYVWDPSVSGDVNNRKLLGVGKQVLFSPGMAYVVFPNNTPNQNCGYVFYFDFYTGWNSTKCYVDSYGGIYRSSSIASIKAPASQQTHGRILVQSVNPSSVGMNSISMYINPTNNDQAITIGLP